MDDNCSRFLGEELPYSGYVSEVDLQMEVTWSTIYLGETKHPRFLAEGVRVD